MRDEKRSGRRTPWSPLILSWSARRKIRDYLDRLENAIQIKDLQARETGLGEIRSALLSDFIGGQVKDGHYRSIQEHLDEAIKDTRMKNIEDSFQDLPFHVVELLQDVLEDGKIDPEEIDHVGNVLDREGLPDKERRRVLDRLERWHLVDELYQA